MSGSVGCSKAARHGLQLTTLLQRIGGSGWWGGEVDLQPLNSTVRLLQILVKIEGSLVAYQIPAISAT